jgi:hypothetical protein
MAFILERDDFRAERLQGVRFWFGGQRASVFTFPPDPVPYSFERVAGPANGAADFCERENSPKRLARLELLNWPFQQDYD